MMRPHKCRHPFRIWRQPAKNLVTTDHRIRWREVRLRLVAPRISAISARQRFEILDDGPIARSRTVNDRRAHRTECSQESGLQHFASIQRERKAVESIWGPD